MGSAERNGVTRRDLLAASAGLGLALGSGSLLRPDRASGTSQVDYDVIVIGGGFAGVTAARELRGAGHSVLLIEARNRLGGRTLTAEFAGRPTDLGGTWIHWSQPYVWSESRRYGLALEESVGAAADDFIFESGGRVQRARMSEIWEPLDSAVRAYFEPSREIFPRPHEPFFSESYREVEKLSGLDRLGAIELSEVQRDLLNGYFSTTGHNSLDRIAWVELMRCYALAGHDLIDLNDALARYRFRDGSVALLDAMAADVPLEVKLGSPVMKVAQDATGVTVTTEEEEQLRARYAVVTLPLNVLKDVDFSPALHPGKLAASKETHAGVGTKFHVLLRGRQGNLAAAAPTGKPQPITYLFTEHEGESDTHMIGFGPSPKFLNVADRDAVQRAVRKFLPDAEVEVVRGYQWNLDPFSQGTWCLYRPGQYGRYLAHLQATEGRLVFASSDWADGWRGFIDGAIESGLSASRQVMLGLG